MHNRQEKRRRETCKQNISHEQLQQRRGNRSITIFYRCGLWFICDTVHRSAAPANFNGFIFFCWSFSQRWFLAWPSCENRACGSTLRSYRETNRRYASFIKRTKRFVSRFHPQAFTDLFGREVSMLQPLGRVSDCHIFTQEWPSDLFYSMLSV